MPFDRERRRCPLVLVAYGDEGGRWLADVLQELRRGADARRLIELNVIQAWLVGGTASGEGIVELGELPEVETTARLLDAARSLAVLDLVPGLVLTEVRVIERVSLFGGSVDAWRPALVRALQTVPDAVHASGTQARFVYRWLALADSIHDPLGIDDDDRHRARRIIDSAPVDADTLLIDRSTESLASLHLGTADRLFAALVPLYVHADLGAPLAMQAGEIQRPAMRLDDPSFCAFTVHQLMHRHASLREARRDGLLRALANGSGIEPARWTDLPKAEELERVLNEDLSALGSGGYDPMSARIGRRTAAGAILMRAFAQQDASEMRMRVALSRKRADGGLATAASQSAPAATAPSPSMTSRVLAPIPTLIVAGSFGAGALASALGTLPLAAAWRIPVTVLLGVIALAQVVGSFIVHRKEPPTIGDVSTRAADERRSDQNEVRTEWLALCDEVLGVLDAFDALRGHPPADTRGWWRRRGEGVWEYDPEPFWLVENEGPLSLARCIELAEMATRRMGNGLDGLELLRSAADAILQDRRGAGRGKASDLAWIIDPDETVELKRALERPALLVNSTHPVPRAMVLWFTAPEAGLRAGLPELEAAQSRDRAAYLTIDDAERTVRLEFGEPQLWDRLPALTGSREPVS